MTICLPVTMDGQVGDGWGRASRVAVATATATGAIESWEEFPVGWDVLHDEGGEGQHHARIAKFLMEHQVQRVISGHMGPGMVHMLDKMSIGTVLGVHGNAREVASIHGR